MSRPLSQRVLEGLPENAQLQLGLTAARMAFTFWQRAFPEKAFQAPLANALDAVQAYCTSGHLAPGTKATAERAYQAVSGCDLPSGDIQRSAGFAVAHIAMAPWFMSVGKLSSARHSAAVAINYSESIHQWAGRLQELEAALAAQAQALRGG